MKKIIILTVCSFFVFGILGLILLNEKDYYIEGDLGPFILKVDEKQYLTEIKSNSDDFIYFPEELYFIGKTEKIEGKQSQFDFIIMDIAENKETIKEVLNNGII